MSWDWEKLRDNQEKFKDMPNDFMFKSQKPKPKVKKKPDYKGILQLTGFIIGYILLFCVISFGMFWLAKNISYWLFYEDMVKETIKELVKSNCLIIQ